MALSKFGFKVKAALQLLFSCSLPVLPPQSRLAQQERNHVDLWIFLLDLGEKSFCLIILLALKSVLRFQDGIKFPQLVLRIGEPCFSDSGETAARNPK